MTFTHWMILINKNVIVKQINKKGRISNEGEKLNWIYPTNIHIGEFDISY